MFQPICFPGKRTSASGALAVKWLFFAAAFCAPINGRVWTSTFQSFSSAHQHRSISPGVNAVTASSCRKTSLKKQLIPSYSLFHWGIRGGHLALRQVGTDLDLEGISSSPRRGLRVCLIHPPQVKFSNEHFHLDLRRNIKGYEQSGFQCHLQNWGVAL